MSTFTVSNTEIIWNPPRDLGPYPAEVDPSVMCQQVERDLAQYVAERVKQKLFSSTSSGLYYMPTIWQVECPICGHQFSSTEMPQWAPLNPYEVVLSEGSHFLVTCGAHSLYDVWEQRSRTSRRRYREPAFIPKRRRRR